MSEAENELLARTKYSLRADGAKEDLIEKLLLEVSESCAPRDASKLLGEALGHSSWNVRKYAANLMVQVGQGTFLTLHALLTEGNLDQVYWACWVLAQLEGDRAPILSEALAHPNK